MEMKFRILVETENSTRNLTIQGVEDKDFREFKERNGRKGLQELTDYLRNFDIDIWGDTVDNPITEDM